MIRVSVMVRLIPPDVPYLVQILSSVYSVLRKSPSTIFIIDQKIQAPIQSPAQTLGVLLSVCLSFSRRRSIKRDADIFPHSLSLPRITTDSLSTSLSVTLRFCLHNVFSFRVPHQSLYLIRRLGGLVADQQLIVPCLITVASVYANVFRSRLAYFLLSFPFDVSRGIFLVVEVSCERQR